MKKVLFFLFNLVVSSSLALAQTDDLLRPCGPGVPANAEIGQSYYVLETFMPSYFLGSEIASLAKTPPCALQNFLGMQGTDTTGPRGVIGTVEPSIVSISSNPVIVRFDTQGAGLSGPFDAYLPSCLPAATNGAKICEVNPFDSPKVLFRLRSSNGTFDGKWKYATDTSNPYFQMKRVGECQTGMPTLTNPSNGFPCSYEIRFATDLNGIPALKTAMQVMFTFMPGGGGIRVTPLDGGNFIGYSGASSNVIPMLFIPSSTNSVTIQTSKLSIISGEEITVTGKVVGTIVPSSLPTLALESAALNSATFTQISQSVTDAAGVANFKIKPLESSNYRLSLVGNGVGATVVSPTNTVLVTSNSQVLVNSIDALLQAISKVKAIFPKAKATEQKTFKTLASMLNGDISKFVKANSTTIKVTSNKVNITKLWKDANSKVSAALKLKKTSFASDLSLAKKALITLKKGIQIN